MSHTETPPSNRVSRARTWRRRFGLLVMGVCLALGCIEVGLRLIGFRYATFGVPDSVRGWSLGPGLEDVYTLEGRARVSINSHGYRDAERTRVKPSGVYRIAVLGDSFVEARQVEHDETFCAALERMLNDRGIVSPRRAEVLNFGVAGYGIAQELLTLQNDVLSFDPDVVLLAFWSGNDVLDNARSIDRSPKRDWRPYYELAGDELTLDNSFHQSASFRRHTSLLGRMAYGLRDNLRLEQLAIAVVYAASDPRERPQWQWRDELGLSSDVYKEPGSPLWTDAWRVTERLIVEMNRDSRSHAVGFGVVTLSTGVQVYPDASVRRSLTDEIQVADLFYPERRIAALGQQSGFPVLNLAPAMQKQADAKGVFFHGFDNTQFGWGHWNADGHQFAATRMAEWLSEPGVRSQLTATDAAKSH
ncbi:MAG: SGNH/GDSL hydrolase family protein [Planctomycetaceae bacterium]